MTTSLEYHDGDDRIISIVTWLPHTEPVQVPARTVSAAGYAGGSLHPTWPVPRTELRYVASERKHAAPGPPLNLTVGKRSIVQRLKGRLGRGS